GDEDAGPGEQLQVRGEHPLHLRPRGHVERRQRLVEEQHLRFDDQGPGQGDPLGLASRELRRHPPAETGEAETLQPFLRPLQSLPSREAPGLEAEGDVLGHRHPGEQQAVLEDHADAPLLRRDEHARRRVVPHLATEGDASRGDREQPGDRRHRGRLPRTIGAEQRDGVPLRRRESQLEVETVAPDLEVEVEAHNALVHRSRSATSTPRETSTITRLMATAVSRSLSSATNTAKGMVWVRPCRLPANVTVAPNSPNARAQVSSRPDTRDGAIIGSVTRRSTVHLPAPSVAAAPSWRPSRLRSAPSTVITRKGIATKVVARIT